MREILFRGFHKDENGKETIYLNGKEIKGNWVYGYFVKGAEKYVIMPHLARLYEVIPETVGQWSGLENPYNQKIFEHDILREYSNDIEDWEVSYEYGKFEGTYDNVCKDLYEISDLEVIGTIFDEKEVK